MPSREQEQIDEQRRVGELKAYGLLDTPNEPVFDAIVKRAASAFDTPIALISLIDENRQWFEARHGLEPAETPRAISFCTHAIRGPQVMVVEDASKDDRFETNPLVTGDPNIRFYAGAPLKTATGRRIGTLCIIGREARGFSEAAQQRLQEMAEEVMTAVEQRGGGKK